MRDQYAGDVSDYFKFALLRRLASSVKRLAVCWYYVPSPDGPVNGRHVGWWQEDGWAALDPELSQALSSLSTRSIIALEESSIWPRDVIFHGAPVPQSTGRLAWGVEKRSVLEAADLVFLDPDNGLGNSIKHATLSEVRLLRKQGRTIVFITFPGRKNHVDQLRDLHEALRVDCGVEQCVTLRISAMMPSNDGSSRSPRIRWFTVVDGDEEMTAELMNFSASLNALPHVKAEVSGQDS